MPLHDPLLPDDLLDVASTLERRRPQLTGLELDELKRRTMRAARSTTGTRTHKGTFMRSRTAITTLLASGLLLSGGSTAIGVSALQSTGDAGVAQYGTTTTTTPTPSGSVAGTEAGESGAGAPGAAGTAGNPGAPGDTLAEAAGGTPTGDDTGEALGTTAAGGNPVQAVRQVGVSSGDSLPFTGYAAVPVLLLGMALFAAGLVLRRRPAER